jgi:hypothetical protein
MSAFVPVVIGEKLRIIQMSRSDPHQRDIDQHVAEQFRIAGIGKRRQYVKGEQYDDENYKAMVDQRIDPLTGRLPEHLRLHAYSTQLGESVGFIADQLAESFEVVAEDKTADEVIHAALRLSNQLSGSGDDEDVSVEELFEDAMVAGDVAVELRWDPIEQAVFYDLWEAESVEIEWADRDNMERVILRELIWVTDPDSGDDRQVLERTEFEMMERVSETDDEVMWLECQRRVYWDEDEEPEEVEWTGFPALPWKLLRCSKKGLRGQRGESLISLQAMQAADRYNANEQVAWLIARYNSHSNLAVTGDAALLKMQQDEGADKDVDDILGFPGGTSVTVLKMPTDPQMIEHQRKVLAESIYAAFGLTRIEPDTIEGLGGISGYALEILNRKSEGTFRKIRRHFTRDLRTLFATTLDFYEALFVEPPDLVDPDSTELVDEPAGSDVPQWVTAEDVDLFPNRRMEIRMGSGYVVDDVLVRDDFTTGLTSRKDALRRRGRSDKEIKRITDEIDDEKQAAAERFSGGESGRFASVRGSTTGTPGDDDPATVEP